MTRRRGISLAWFVAGTLVLVTTALLVTLGVIGYKSEARRQRINLETVTRIQADELAVALTLPVWNIDRPQIEKVLEAMSRPRSIWGIRVTAGNEVFGRRRDTHWQLVPWTTQPEPPGMLVETRPIMFNGRPIGTVRLVVTAAFVNDDLRPVLNPVIGAVVAIDLLIIVTVYLILWRAVLRPLTDIERYAAAVGAGEEMPALMSVRAPAELQSLRSSIESMVNLLAQREERFRSIFESVNDAIFILCKDTGAILDVNSRMTEMFGYTREEAVALGVPAVSSGRPPYTVEDASRIIRALQPGDRQIFEWHARHRDGHLFWVEVSLRLATIGGVVRVLSVARDVDERRKMQEALRRSETMSMIGGIVAGVAHEVRNPLFGIAAAVDAFEAESGGDSLAAEYLATLRNDVTRLNRLMTDLLEYGRPHETERRLQSIQPVIAEAIRVCTPRAREKRIEIRQEGDGDLPEVAIDADRMLLVLKNVVENAVEFSSAGEAVVMQIGRDGDASLVCTISDRGPGFRAEDLPRVFEPFFTRRPGGSGLGLAIVQKIVHDHGGTISARNREGGGGVVEIRIPTVVSS